MSYHPTPDVDGPVPLWPEPEPRRWAGREALSALGLAVLVALLGFPLGWLWSAVAPHAPAVMTGDGPVYQAPNQEQLVGAEGWYVFLTFLAGVLLAVLAWTLLPRYRGVPALLALGVGAVVAGPLAFWTGHHIGLAHARYLLAHAPVGTHFQLPVNLRVQQVGLWHGWLPYARGDVLFLAIAAVLSYALLAGFSAYPSLRPPAPGPVGSDYEPLSSDY